MELSQRLDLAKLGLDPDLVPDNDSDSASGDDRSAPGSGDKTGVTGTGPSGTGDALAQLAGLLAQVGVVEDAGEVETNDTFDSLGVDSLTRIELAVRAEEHFGVRVHENAIDPSWTVGEMAQFFSDKTNRKAPEEV